MGIFIKGNADYNAKKINICWALLTDASTIGRMLIYLNHHLTHSYFIKETID